MKTYKLIKTYPGSFPLGHLAILDKSVKYYNLGTTTRSLDYIENHPENWQHVCYKCHENVNTCKTFGCKKVYEILSFKDVRNNSMFSYTLRKNGLYIYQIYEDNIFNKMPNIKRKLQDCLNNSTLTIHSVKRLSDGEVFTVGDKLHDKSFVKNARHAVNVAPWNNIITKIGIVKNSSKEVAGYLNCNGKLMLLADNVYGNYNVSLENAVKLKQPILITEDGIEFFDDSSIVYYVNILNFGILSTIISSIKPNMQSYVLNNKFFGCISAANKYAEENKPKVKLFTTEDGVDIFAGNTYVMVTNDLFESRTLVAMGNEINNIKRFSTKKAAENYIKMNKPCLSLNDVLSITNKTSFVPEDFSKNLIKKELTKIVKQKLK